MNEWINQSINEWVCERFCPGQFNEATSDADHALEFLKYAFVDDLDGYDGDSVQYIVAVLRERYPEHNASSAQLLNNAKRRRSNASSQTHRNNNNNNNKNDGILILSSSSSAATDAGDSRYSVTTATPDVAMGDGVRGFFDAADDVAEEYANVRWTTDVFSGAIPVNSSGTETKSNNRSSVPPPSYFENNSYAERLLEIAHIFHFVSIAILGIFVIQVRWQRYGYSGTVMQVKRTWILWHCLTISCLKHARPTLRVRH